MMVNDKKLKPMPDVSFKGMTWLFKFRDLVGYPQRRLKKIPLKEGMAVVDYGCGTGSYTILAAKLVGPKGKVFAVDIQPLAIKMIKEKAARESLTNIEPVLVDSYDTGIQGSSIDLVLLLDTLHMINDRQVLFREIHRLLKPDGLIFMDPGHMRISRGREIVENTGLFTMVECRGHDMLAAPKAKQ
jgi:ubiquinone/menaquinone biosynthesis C-methylase UbiE